MHNNMRYLMGSSLLVLMVLFVAGCIEDATLTSADMNSDQYLAKNNVIHHVSMGGNDACAAFGLAPGCDANFSLVANMKADGSVSGQYQDTFNGGGAGIHVDIDCMNIDGNTAVVGGVITKGTDIIGLRALTALVDNGTNSHDVQDQISFSFFTVNDCGSLTVADFPLLNLDKGQVKIK